MKHRWALRVVVMTALLLSANAASAQSWPTRPVRIVVPYAPGGPVDIVSRTVAQRLGTALGQSVLIDNRPGGNTAIGTQHVARSAPDGYTLLMTTPSIAIATLLEPRPSYGMEDFAPVANIVKVPYALTVSASLPVHDLGGLARLAQGRPAGLNNGIIGYGSVVHLTAELFRQSSALSMVHVPYRGGGPATTALISGEIDLFFTGVVNAIPQARAGTLRVLGVTHYQRLPAAPDIPTFVEQGYPMVLSYSYYGLLAPARTPPSILNRLATEIHLLAEDPEFRVQMERDAAVIDSAPGEAFGKMIADDLAIWAQVIRGMGTQVQQ